MEDFVNIPKTKRGQKTMDNIVRSAEGLFFEKGYHASSIIDITNEANIALGTFYIYFKDKYSLYKYLLLNYNHEIRKAIAQDIKPHHTRFEAEEIGLRAFLQYIRKHKHVYNIIWESLYIDKSLFVDYYENFASRYLHGLEAAQDRGEIVKVDPTVLSYFLMGVSNFIGLKYVMFDDDDEESFDAVVDQVMEILRTGIFLGK